MSNERSPTHAHDNYGDIAPKLAQVTDEVLFGDIWKRAQLSPRDRSLVTCAGLIMAGKTEQMGYHFSLALDNGLTTEELLESITHLAFYAGLPNAVSAVSRMRDVLAKR